jgi:PAS domain S-box-containing protein
LCYANTGSLKLYLSEGKKKVTKRNSDIMDTMIDGVITIDPKGKILVFNKKAEEIFGYRKKQVLKKNVSMLMPPEVGREHNGYLKTYRRTKQRHIIGIGRQVKGRHSDGHEFAIHLSISESKTGDESLFTATIRVVDQQDASSDKREDGPASASAAPGSEASDMAVFGLLDCLLDATVVINQAGIIQFWNKAASERLGFSKAEVVGKNIKICMPASIGGNQINTFASFPFLAI